MSKSQSIGIEQKNSQKVRKKRKCVETSSSEEEWFSSEESTDKDQYDEVQNSEQLVTGPWRYNLDEVLQREEFDNTDICKEMNASDFNFEYVQENGLEEPLLFKDSVIPLGMKMPRDGTLTVSSVLKAVGDRQIEVVDVMTQSSRYMMLSDFVEYYESPSGERNNLLNLLSLEFSLTPLAKKIRAPALAREIDWVELYWPKELRNSSETFPKVQNYCLMSVKGSFTDFHIDFGGTSVWYHVYKGRKIFWVIEPTEENIQKYENWVMEGTQYESFFGELVDKCTRITLCEGCTFIIPSGWIHAVYTPEDSLVFGGNFLHSYSIPMQLRISRSEDILKIKKKYRYPKIREMLWYVVKNIVEKATGRTFQINKTKASNTVKKTNSNNEILTDKNDTNGGEGNSNKTTVTTKGIVSSKAEADSMEAVSITAELKKHETGLRNKEEVSNDKIRQFPEKLLISNTQQDAVAIDNEYVATMSKKERDGYKVLLDYMRESMKDERSHSQKREMNDLLDLFEIVLTHEVPEHFIIDKEKKKRLGAQAIPKLNHWLTASGKNKTPATKRKVSSKEKGTEIQQPLKPKLSSKLKMKSSKKLDCHKPDGPLIVGGIPPAIMPADAPQAPNPYGYDPLASVTPLGHKQLPSAYRRTPDMAKAPPSQKFRLQPQMHKITSTGFEKVDVELEKTSEKLPPTHSISLSESSNADKLAKHGRRNVAIAQSGNEKSIHRAEFVRSHHDRDKDNQHIVKEEYPELQYRSPLARASSSNSVPKIVYKPNYGTCQRGRFLRKVFKRRYPDSVPLLGRRFSASEDARRLSEIDSEKNAQIFSSCSGRYRKSSSMSNSGSFTLPPTQQRLQEKSSVSRLLHSMPGDPHLPSAEARWSPASKDLPTKECGKDKNSSSPQLVHTAEVTKTTTAQQKNWKLLSTTAIVPPITSQYVPLLNHGRAPVSASVDTCMPHPRSEGTKGISQLPVPLTANHTLPLPEPQRNALGQHELCVEEVKIPEIRELSLTLNEDDEDDKEIITATEELAELTKVFDADECDSKKKETIPTTLAVENRKRQMSITMEKSSDILRDRSPSQASVESETASPSSKLPKIPTETVLQNLSSLMAEFNAVED